MCEGYLYVKVLLEGGGGPKSSLLCQYDRNSEHFAKLLNIFMLNSFIWFASLPALSVFIPLDYYVTHCSLM
jgi:hypothetical protein